MACRYYLLIVSADILRGEHTNVGLMVYDERNQLAGVKVVPDLERANQRGDNRPEYNRTPADIEAFARSFPDKAALDKWFDSYGGAAASLNIIPGGASTRTPEATLEDMYRRLVEPPRQT